jgi:hypothetical protein
VPDFPGERISENIKKKVVIQIYFSCHQSEKEVLPKKKYIKGIPFVVTKYNFYNPQ